MSRRGANEGSIYRRKDGRWVAVLDLGERDGRRRRRSFYGETRKAAQEQLTAALHDRQRGVTIAPDGTTVAQFLATWLEEVVRPRNRAGTHERYARVVSQHLVPALGGRRLVALGPAEVQRLLNRKAAAGLAPRTVALIRAVLRRALAQAQRWGLVARNAAALVDPPRIEPYAACALDPAGARRLLAAARGDRLEAIIAVALGLGLRKGEALGLRWVDVDLAGGAVAVRGQLNGAGGGAAIVGELKTPRSRRALALPAVVAAALVAHRERQARERAAAGEQWREHGLVFPSSIGTPLGPRNLTRAFHGLLARSGLARMRWHDLRHSAASILLAQGVDLRTVMEVLGHSQIGVTMDTYAHVTPALGRRAAELMDAALREEPCTDEA